MAVPDPRNNTGNLPKIPYPRWSEALDNSTPDAVRNEEENYTELSRWSLDMLRRGWPGSGGLNGGFTSPGGNAGPIAPGGTIAVNLFNPADYTWPGNAAISETRIAVVRLHVKIQPLTVPLGLIDCDIVYNGQVYQWLMGASAAGDVYSMNIVELIPVTDAVTVLTFNVYPPSAQAVTFNYTASIFV